MRFTVTIVVMLNICSDKNRENVEPLLDSNMECISINSTLSTEQKSNYQQDKTIGSPQGDS